MSKPKLQTQKHKTQAQQRNNSQDDEFKDNYYDEQPTTDGEITGVQDDFIEDVNDNDTYISMNDQYEENNDYDLQSPLPTIEETIDEPRDVQVQESIVTTRSGRQVKPVNNYIPSFSGQKYKEFVNINVSNNNIEYGHSFGIVLARIIQHISFLHYNLRQGIKLFGDKGREAAFKELEQLHLRKVFHPLDINELPHEERKKALESLIFLRKRKMVISKIEHVLMVRRNEILFLRMKQQVQLLH